MVSIIFSILFENNACKKNMKQQRMETRWFDIENRQPSLLHMNVSAYAFVDQ